MRPHLSRDRIVDAMRAYGKPLSPTQLSVIIDQPLGATAYHVRALFSAGVIDMAGKSRAWGPGARFYVLVGDTGREVPFSGAVERLLVLTGAMTVPATDGSYPSPATVDEQARAELTEIINTIAPAVRRLAAASTERIGAAPSRNLCLESTDGAAQAASPTV
jgi:hypothetical protein